MTELRETVKERKAHAGPTRNGNGLQNWGQNRFREGDENLIKKSEGERAQRIFQTTDLAYLAATR